VSGARHDMAIAIIGCGNPNRSDDGVGTEVVRTLRSRQQFHVPGVVLLDAGTDGMGVMFAARGSSSLIVIDACRSGSHAGAIFEVPGTELESPHVPSLTLHDFRWDHALFAGRRLFGAAFPKDITVFLVEAKTLEIGIGLSEPVARAAGEVALRIESMVLSKLQSANECERGASTDQ
jgi:hydrogenase maturation protease